MKQRQKTLSNIIFISLTFYCLTFPFIVSQLYNDSNVRTFLRFYFAKKKCVSWLGYIISIIVCSCSLIYYFIFKILDIVLTILVLNIIIPICNFLFKSNVFNPRSIL